MAKNKKIVFPSEIPNIDKLGEHLLNEFNSNPELISEPNKKLENALKEYALVEDELIKHKFNGLWFSFMNFYAIIKNNKLDLSEIFGHSIIDEIVTILFINTKDITKTITEKLFRKLNKCETDPEFKKRFEEDNKAFLKLHPYLLKLKLDEATYFRIMLHYSDVIFLEQIKKVIAAEKYAEYFKAFESNKLKFSGLLKTIVDNGFGKITLNDLQGRMSSFNIGENTTIKIHVNSFLEEFITEYNQFRNYLKECNKILGSDALSPDLANLLITLFEFETLDYMSSISIQKLLRMNTALLNDERSAKLFTHHILCYTGILGITTRQAFEEKYQTEADYTKLRILEIDRYNIH